MKVCRRCKKEKEASEFHISPQKKDGLNSFCKECTTLAARASYAKNKALTKIRSEESKQDLTTLVGKIKSNKGCSFCNEKDECCLDFHHINDDKEGQISNLARDKKKIKLFEEINKCIVVCSNCHRKVHKGKLNCEGIIPCEEKISDYFDLRYGRYFKKK